MGTEDRGFASMDKDKQRAIASKGGKAAHAQGKAHTWTSEEAKAAGRKGGLRIQARRKAATEVAQSPQVAPEEVTS